MRLGKPRGKKSRTNSATEYFESETYNTLFNPFSTPFQFQSIQGMFADSQFQANTATSAVQREQPTDVTDPEVETRVFSYMEEKIKLGIICIGNEVKRSDYPCIIKYLRGLKSRGLNSRSNFFPIILSHPFTDHELADFLDAFADLEGLHSIKISYATIGNLAAEKLAVLIENKVYSVSFNACKFENAGWTIFLNAIKDNVIPVNLDIYDCYFGFPELMYLASYGYRMQKIRFGNEVPFISSFIERLMQQRFCYEIDLETEIRFPCKVNAHEEGFPSGNIEICVILKKGNKTCEVQIGHNSSQVKDVEIPNLGLNNSLFNSRIILVNLQIHVHTAKSIASLIFKSYFTELKFEGCNFTDEGIRILVNALRMNCHIKRLNFGNQNICEKQILMLLKAIERNYISAPAYSQKHNPYKLFLPCDALTHPVARRIADLMKYMEFQLGIFMKSNSTIPLEIVNQFRDSLELYASHYSQVKLFDSTREIEMQPSQDDSFSKTFIALNKRFMVVHREGEVKKIFANSLCPMQLR